MSGGNPLAAISKARANGGGGGGGGGLNNPLEQLSHSRAGGGSAPSPPPHRSSGKHRGFLGSVGHFIADKTERAAADVKSIPGGMYDIVNTEQHLLRKTIAHPLADPNGPNGVNSGKWGRHANALVHGMERGAIESVKHPVRDPLQTVTTLLPL